MTKVKHCNWSTRYLVLFLGYVIRCTLNGGGYSWSSWSKLLEPGVTLSNYSASFHCGPTKRQLSPTAVRRAARVASCSNACYPWIPDRCRPRLLHFRDDVLVIGGTPEEGRPRYASFKSPITIPSLQRVEGEMSVRKGIGRKRWGYHTLLHCLQRRLPRRHIFMNVLDEMIVS
jgi:hypothetical protein